MAADFDDSRLENRQSLQAADEILRRLAGAGARLRIDGEGTEAALATLTESAGYRPRAILAAGPEARLVRALVEPTCPVPFVAWPHHGLPGWFGPLDLLVVMAPDNGPAELAATVAEGVRRGATVLVACSPDGPIAPAAAGRNATVLPITTADPLAAAVVAGAALAALRLGPALDVPAVAAAVDRVAEDCSPYVDLSVNPAKDLALGLAEAQPLVWGGSVLAARASRRVAEALRAASGRTALAADAAALATVLDVAGAKDLFADPFEDSVTDRHPGLVVLDDGHGAEEVHAERTRLTALADDRGIRVCVVSHTEGSELERYASLLQTGLYAAAYLAIGLGRV